MLKLPRRRAVLLSYSVNYASLCLWTNACTVLARHITSFYFYFYDIYSQIVILRRCLSSIAVQCNLLMREMNSLSARHDSVIRVTIWPCRQQPTQMRVSYSHHNQPIL